MKSDVDAAGRRVLDDVGEAFGHEEIGRALELDREASRRSEAVGMDLDRDRHPRRTLGDGLDKAAVGEDRGVNPTRQLLQALERALGVDLGFAQRVFGQVLVAFQLVASQSEARQHADQLLLDAIVEITFEPAAARLLRLDQARARGRQLLETI